MWSRVMIKGQKTKTDVTTESHWNGKHIKTGKIDEWFYFTYYNLKRYLFNKSVLLGKAFIEPLKLLGKSFNLVVVEFQVKLILRKILRKKKM